MVNEALKQCQIGKTKVKFPSISAKVNISPFFCVTGPAPHRDGQDPSLSDPKCDFIVHGGKLQGPGLRKPGIKQQQSEQQQQQPDPPEQAGPSSGADGSGQSGGDSES